MTIEGNIVNKDGINRGRIEIGDNGLILSATSETGSADVILKDELIFPGFIDLHVHARECVDHSWDYKEDFFTASEAAINGGVVAFGDMPNNPVAPIDDESYELKLSLAKKSAVDVLLYAGIGPKTRPLSKNVPYKVFMGPSVGDLFFKNNTDLEEVIKNYQGKNISFHCEDPGILELNKNQPTHEQKRPEEAENSAVDFALQMIEKYELIGKICHCSNMEGMQKIIAAKKRGLKVTCEVTPHHLYFDTDEIARSASDEAISLNNGIASSLPESGLAISKTLQVNPPIRQSKENRLALIEMLKNGDIDYLATDHAPHTLEEKQKGTSGMPHLDTYGSFVTWLIKEHHFSASDVMRVCSYNPGLFLNEFASVKYGKIEPGYVGSLTILDLNNPLKIEKSMLKTKCGWSPFEGVEFPGSVGYTLVRGKLYKV